MARGASDDVEVRRAVRLTVRLGEAGAVPAAGSWGGVGDGAGAEAGGGVQVRRARVVTGDEGDDELGGDGDGRRVADEDEGIEELGEGEGADAPAVTLADAARADLRSGKRIVISLDSGVMYDDNIYLRGVDPVADTLWRVGGEVRLNSGDVVRQEDSHLAVMYRLEAYFFHENTGENTVDHEATLSWRRKFAKLAVDAAGKYQRTSGSTVDLGDRVPRDVVVARAGLVHEATAKVRVGTVVRWDSTTYREGAYSDYREWAHDGYADYQVTEKFQLGLGGTYGRLEVDDGSEPQDFQRAMMRVRYAATGKLDVAGRVGSEFRQTEVGDTATPVFGLEATHDLTGKTSVRLLGVREVAASGSLEGQNYVRTGVSGGVTHRLSERLSVGLDGGWEQYEYEAASKAALGLADRTDNGVFVRPGFTYVLGDRWKAEAWYQWRSSDSTDPTQEYDVNQAGINLRCEF